MVTQCLVVLPGDPFEREKHVLRSETQIADKISVRNGGLGAPFAPFVPFYFGVSFFLKRTLGKGCPYDSGVTGESFRSGLESSLEDFMGTPMGMQSSIHD